MPGGSNGSAGYWLLVSVLCLFGSIGIFSIGVPFLLLGVTLAVVAPWRNQRAVLWPAVTGVVGFVVGFLLVAPLGCTTTASSGHSAQSTTCANILGIDYSGPGLYNPSIASALVAGLTLFVLAAATVRAIVKRQSAGTTGGTARTRG